MENYIEAIRKESKEFCDKLTAEGVEFKKDEYWDQYIHLGDGHGYIVCKAESAVNALGESKELIAAGDADNITHALQMSLSEEKPEIEYCTNNEWLRVYGGYEPEEDTGNDDIDEKRWSETRKEFEDIFGDLADIVGAQDQRIMCHGWNGAGFTHRNGGHATFNVLTEKGEKRFNEI